MLLLAAIGLIGAFTATVASYVVEQKAGKADEQLAHIEVTLEQLLAETSSEHTSKVSRVLCLLRCGLFSDAASVPARGHGRSD